MAARPVPEGDGVSTLLRVSVTAEAAGLDPADLLARMSAMFPGRVEERRDGEGHFEVAAFAAPPLTLPAGLGPWRVEPVGASRIRVWEEHHHGLEIAGCLWVGPPDEEPPDGVQAVRIQPRGVFGSGAHATTSGCLELLCELSERTSVLDLGCGSGVLAVCAAVLGHHPVHACDSDPLAVSAARANAEANDAEVDVFEADAATDALPEADLWLANVSEGAVADVLRRPDRPAAAIVSGLPAGAPLDYPGYAVERRLERAGWLAARLSRTA